MLELCIRPPGGRGRRQQMLRHRAQPASALRRLLAVTGRSTSWMRRSHPLEAILNLQEVPARIIRGSEDSANQEGSGRHQTNPSAAGLSSAQLPAPTMSPSMLMRCSRHFRFLSDAILAGAGWGPWVLSVLGSV